VAERPAEVREYEPDEREALTRLSFATRAEDPVADYIACRRIPATPNKTKRAASMIIAHSDSVGMAAVRGATTTFSFAALHVFSVTELFASPL
jgi:hypothetical protein